MGIKEKALLIGIVLLVHFLASNFKVRNLFNNFSPTKTAFHVRPSLILDHFAWNSKLRLYEFYSILHVKKVHLISKPKNTKKPKSSPRVRENYVIHLYSKKYSIIEVLFYHPYSYILRTKLRII